MIRNKNLSLEIQENLKQGVKIRFKTYDKVEFVGRIEVDLFDIQYVVPEEFYDSGDDLDPQIKWLVGLHEFSSFLKFKIL